MNWLDTDYTHTTKSPLLRSSFFELVADRASLLVSLPLTRVLCRQYVRVLSDETSEKGHATEDQVGASVGLPGTRAIDCTRAVAEAGTCRKFQAPPKHYWA